MGTCRMEKFQVLETDPEGIKRFRGRARKDEMSVDGSRDML